MQDDAPCHKAKTVLIFLEEEGIAVMKWLQQSPGMNPIENEWKIIGEKALNKNARNIDATIGKKLIGLCGRRCNEVIQGKG